MQLIGMLRHGTCLDAGPRLDDLCDGELTERHERRVRRHIAGCRSCRRRLQCLQATLDDLTGLGRRPTVAAPSVRDRVAAVLTTPATTTTTTTSDEAHDPTADRPDDAADGPAGVGR